MSWPEMVKNNLIGSGMVSRAAICGHDGVVWGKSDGFNITEEEALSVVRGFASPDACRGNGLRLENFKYFVLNVDDERIIAKKESRGFFAYKTAQTVIVAVYEAGIQPEQCSKVAGALADYFKSTGY